jgi:crotonobetainyl-CoA:carnitine CoA-transferase CaiB-like acyl-CoA transferase
MSKWPAYDHTIKAISGMMWTGADDDIPSQARGFSVDCFSGYLAYAAILSGLLRRERTGEGQYLDVAMLDSALVLMGVGVVRQEITGDGLAAAQPIVHDRPTVAPYRTRDGWIWLSANFQAHWKALCAVLGAADLEADPRFADVRTRMTNGAALKTILAERIAPRSAADLEAELMAAGCPAARVRTTAEALTLPAIEERALLQPTQVGARSARLMNAGFRADPDSPTGGDPVPGLGEHTEAVLAELGYSASEIGALQDAGAI